MGSIGWGVIKWRCVLLFWVIRIKTFQVKSFKTSWTYRNEKVSKKALIRQAYFYFSVCSTRASTWSEWSKQNNLRCFYTQMFRNSPILRKKGIPLNLSDMSRKSMVECWSSSFFMVKTSRGAWWFLLFFWMILSWKNSLNACDST